LRSTQPSAQSQLEWLVEIPAKVSDHAEREPFGALLVQKRLQLIAREAPQWSIGQCGIEVSLHPIDVRQRRR
jgi:hypothetical protein